MMFDDCLMYDTDVGKLAHRQQCIQWWIKKWWVHGMVSLLRSTPQVPFSALLERHQACNKCVTYPYRFSSRTSGKRNQKGTGYHRFT